MNTTITKLIPAIFAVIFMVVFNASGQVTQEWVKRYNGTGNESDIAFGIALDNSGNLYVAGVSESSNSGSDFCTIKYSQSGVQQLILKYNGPADSSDVAQCIIVDNSGNIYVTGWSYGSSLSADFCTIKYNSSGLVVWLQRYNGPESHNDYGNSIAIDTSGNVYISGSSVGSGTGNDYCIIKYNSSGVQQWVKRYNGPGNGEDQPSKIAADKYGNIIVTGMSTGLGTGFDYCTLKYNAAGTLQWVQRYNGPNNSMDMASSLIIDSSGNIYVTGGSEGSGTGNDFCSIKYNSSGVQQWVKRYNRASAQYDAGTSIALDNSGNVYVTGYSTGSESNQDFCTIKYNSFGTQQWVKFYNGDGNSLDCSNSIDVDNLGNVYITGGSIGIGTGNDYCTVKYNSSGVQQWVQRYNGPGNSVDGYNSIVVNNSGNIYVTGGSVGASSDYDYCTIKYYDPIGIKKISNEIPSAFSLYQNYPNPFNLTTNIKFALPSNSFVKLTIYDMLGRQIEELVNEQLPAGNYEAKWNPADLVSGVYFYEMTSGDFAGVKKMVITK